MGVSAFHLHSYYRDSILVADNTCTAWNMRIYALLNAMLITIAYTRFRAWIESRSIACKWIR